MFLFARIFVLFILSTYLAFNSNAFAADRALKMSVHDHQKEKRIAVVIGNSDYASVPLKNPANDAKSVAAELRKLNFKVYDYYNLTQNDIRKATDRFTEQSGGTALFFFAGHGIQAAGNNYLIPVNADIKSESDIEYEGVNLSRVISRMEEANNRVNIVILDACRNNPFAGSYRSASQGLATVDAPLGSFIAYATAPGRAAADGQGENGVFTSAFLDVLKNTKGVPIEQVFKYVRSQVRTATGGVQIPWTSSSMEGDFFFSPSDKANVSIAQTAPTKQELDTSSASTDFFKDNYTGMLLKRIPAGCFKMGSHPSEKHMESNETPMHRVCLGEYYMGVHEVTQQQWLKVMGMNPSAFQQCGADCPVENVSWQDAQSFIKKLADKTSKNFRLPTEAEWEYAAKSGGKRSLTPDDINEMAWYRSNSDGKTHPVGGKRANFFGLYDMLGNVQEWVSDIFQNSYYSFSPMNNPTGPEDGTRRVIRGGSWADSREKVRLTNRRQGHQDGAVPFIGFRLVMTD